MPKVSKSAARKKSPAKKQTKTNRKKSLLKKQPLTKIATAKSKAKTKVRPKAKAKIKTPLKKTRASGGKTAKTKVLSKPKRSLKKSSVSPGRPSKKAKPAGKTLKKKAASSGRTAVKKQKKLPAKSRSTIKAKKSPVNKKATVTRAKKPSKTLVSTPKTAIVNPVRKKPAPIKKPQLVKTGKGKNHDIQHPSKPFLAATDVIPLEKNKQGAEAEIETEDETVENITIIEAQSSEETASGDASLTDDEPVSERQESLFEQDPSRHAITSESESEKEKTQTES